MLSSLRSRLGIRPLLLLAALALAAAAFAAWWAPRHWGGRSAQSANPLIVSPALALEALQAKSLYYNPPARPWLLEKRPDLLAADDRKPESAQARNFAQATQEPTLFRQLDRAHRFDALYLAGDPSQYQPLMNHLLETSDWKLSYLDHTGIVFRRDATRVWEPARLREVEAKLGAVSSSERALFLAGAASKLLALRKTAAARELLDRAVALDRKTPQVWSSSAQYQMALGEWLHAVADADRALELDPDCLEALAAKAQAQYSSKQFAEALRTSRHLMGLRPDDPQILFYHAKIAHEAGQFGEESDVLKKLIQLAVEEERPTSTYRLHLAQAYARDGQAEMAQHELNLALADPDLPKEFRSFANDCLDLIRQKTHEK